MTQDSSQVNVSADGAVTVATLTQPKMLDELHIGRIGRELEALATAADKPKLVLDFAAVEHMSSSALGMLITLHKRIREKDGQLCLCNIRPSIYEVFVITRLNEIFAIRKSRPEAVDAVNG